MRDSHPRVVIDRRKCPWRWCCPAGHTTWSRTNNHSWCEACSKAEKQGDRSVEPEFYEVIDAKTGRAIPWDAIVFAEY